MARQLRRCMTPAEARLWSKLRANRFHGLQFRRQQITSGYFADFYCFAASLVVEVDGPIHDEQREYDTDRDDALRDRGFTVLRFTNEQVFGALDDVLISIRAATSAAIPPASSLSPPRGEARRGVPRAAESPRVP